MATAFTKIASVAVGSGGTSSISFTSIPQTYTDLYLVITARSNSTYGNAWYDGKITLNSVGSLSRELYGNGTSVTGNYESSQIRILGIPSSGATASTFGSIWVYIPSYTNAQYKAVLVDSTSENNATASMLSYVAGVVENTSAVSSIELNWYTPGALFVQNSTAVLYGVLQA